MRHFYRNSQIEFVMKRVIYIVVSGNLLHRDKLDVKQVCRNRKMLRSLVSDQHHHQYKTFIIILSFRMHHTNC